MFDRYLEGSRVIQAANHESAIWTGFASLAAVMLLLLSTHSSQAATVWSLALTSDAADPIGAGANYSFSNASGSMSTPSVLDLNGDGLVDFVTFAYLGNDAASSFDLTFATASFVNANAGNLVVGAYTGAAKAPFASDGAPGLDITLNGLTPVDLLGSFTITAADFGSDINGLAVGKFESTFSLVADGAAGGLSGNFSYMSDLAGGGTSPVPLPGTAGLFVGGLTLLAGLMRRRHRTSI